MKERLKCKGKMKLLLINVEVDFNCRPGGLKLGRIIGLKSEETYKRKNLRIVLNLEHSEESNNQKIGE